jgi:predicted transcriptional regulator
MFSSQSMADRYEAASRQINDAINRLAELEEERKKLTQVQQEEWERFAWGN